jgi:hypothetical protein
LRATHFGVGSLGWRRGGEIGLCDNTSSASSGMLAALKGGVVGASKSGPPINVFHEGKLSSWSNVVSAFVSAANTLSDIFFAFAKIASIICAKAHKKTKRLAPEPNNVYAHAHLHILNVCIAL